MVGEGGELRFRFWMGSGIGAGMPCLVSGSASREGESERGREVGWEDGAGLWGEFIVGLGRVGGEEVEGHSGFLGCICV